MIIPFSLRRPLCQACRAASGSQLQKSQIHVPAKTAFELLRSISKAPIEYTEAPSERGSTLGIKITASRQANAPVLKLNQEGSDGLSLPLDIRDEALPDDVRDWVKRMMPDGSASLGVVQDVWSTFRGKDWLLFHAEINQQTISNIQVEADDFAIPRQPYLQSITSQAKIHPLSKKANEAKLFYHKTPSGQGANIGCYGYGAGVAMSTMDALVAVGGKPANFLDGGGGATEANVRAALDVLMNDGDLKVIFVNSFGGLTKTELIAQGLVDFLRERVRRGEKYPDMVVRLRGTGEDEAKRILEEATDLTGIKAVPDLREAARAAVEAVSTPGHPSTPPEKQPVQVLSPVIMSKDGQYETSRGNLSVKEGSRVLVMGTGQASLFHNGVAQKFGTNIVGACAPKKGGTTFLDRPLFDELKEAVSALTPEVLSVFVPVTAAADAIIECIETEVPLIVAYAEGIPQRDQLRVQAALRSQSKSRLIGPNCPGMIIPREKVKLGIQPLAVHTPGIVGLASRSGTISYELASQTSRLGLGQSVVYGLGGDPFPGTRTWEVLDLMLKDDHTKVICLVGEIGGQMEEEAAEIYKQYRSNLPPNQTPKPVVGFIAGASTERGLVYGHAGAVWWTDAESAESKKRCWEDAGIIVAPTLGEVGGYIEREARRLGT